MKKLLILVSLVAYALSDNLGLEVGNNRVALVGDKLLSAYKYVFMENQFFLNGRYLHISDKANGKNSRKLINIGIDLKEDMLSCNNSIFSDCGNKAIIGAGVGIVKDDYYTDKDFSAIYFKILLKIKLYKQLIFNANISYAPSTTTYQDGDNYSDIKSFLEYKGMRNISFYMGTEKITVDYIGLNDNFENKVIFGCKTYF